MSLKTISSFLKQPLALVVVAFVVVKSEDSKQSCFSDL